MADQVEFAEGLIVKPPHEKAQDFVKAQISIKVADLGVWLREKHKAGEEWVNLDVKVSKGGKWYAAVNTYKPKEKAPEPKAQPAPATPKGKFDDLDEDLPF
jgi:hypothetical protein